jgi:hypothetical protein
LTNISWTSGLVIWLRPWKEVIPRMLRFDGPACPWRLLPVASQDRGAKLAGRIAENCVALRAKNWELPGRKNIKGDSNFLYPAGLL